MVSNEKFAADASNATTVGKPNVRSSYDTSQIFGIATNLTVSNKHRQ